MFLDDSAFELEDIYEELPKGTSKSGGAFEVNTGRYGSRPTTASSVSSSQQFDDDEGAFGSAGGINTPNSSRARMLAQQRELQLKKRQAAVQSGGMIRSSVEASPMKKTESQFTPAVRQFSAPKAVKDLSADAAEQSSEFSRPSKSSKPVRSRFSDEEDDVKPPKSRGARDDREDENYERNGRSKAPNSRGKRYDDEDDEEEDPQYRSRNGKGKSSSSRRYYDDDDDEEDDIDRRGGAVRKVDKRSTRRDYEDEEEYDEVDDRGDSRRRGDRDGRSKTSSSRGERDDRRGAGPGDRRDRDRERDKGERRGGDRDRDRDDRDREDRRERERGGDRKDRRGGGSRGRGEEDEEEEVDSEADRWGGSGREGGGKGTGKKGKSGARGRELVESEDGPAPTPAVRVTPLNLRDMRTFLTTPVPKSCGVVQCYIRRNKSGTNKLFPIYALYLKDGDRFLMASKKRPNNKTSNYLISMGEGDLNRDGGNYLGKLRSNFVGTEFQVFDNGVSPKEIGEGEDNADEVRKELASVIYAANVLGSRGPRKMQVAIPAVDENDRPVAWRSSARAAASGDDILGRMKDRNLRDLAYLINKPPRWNEQVGAYVLNFNGRVTMASVKNFQLVDPDEQNSVVLQFGRVGKDEFTMDLQWPMTPFQAFAITLSSFDSKIACD